MTEGQRAADARLAAKAGLSLDAWLAAKGTRQGWPKKRPELLPRRRNPPKLPGFFRRLMDRAHKPLGS